MCVKNNTHAARTKMRDLYCCLMWQWEALLTCCPAFPFTANWCFDQHVKVVPGTTFTKGTCNRCGSLQKRGDVVATSRLMWHWKCGVRMPNTWKWPEMNMSLDLNLATFQYIDGSGCCHFCLSRIGLELIIFFWNSSQLSVQFWDCRLLQDCRLTLDCSHPHVGSHLLQTQCCVDLIQPKKESNRQSSA